jgi:two-component system, sensor histidine kinase SagS
VESTVDLLGALQDGAVDGIWISGGSLPGGGDLERLWHSDRMLQDMPDGVALIDDQNKVLWGNKRFHEWATAGNHNGTFYEMLGNPEIMGPDFCPFHTSLAMGRTSGSTLHTASGKFFQVHAAPLARPIGVGRQLVVTVSDITDEIVQQQKLQAIHRAGRELADLQPDEIFLMDVDQRIELLKQNIGHYLSDLLNFHFIEIRLLEQTTGHLVSLLHVGIDEAAANRALVADVQGNGVTGYVASTGVSYVCEDTLADPLYITGVTGAKSSLTVPLMLHEQVLGTINVESKETGAFTDSDVQLLEIFARDVAHALNTLELLVAQKANTAQQSCEAIHSAVAMPVDEILNDAVNVMEHYIGHDAAVVDRLRRILQNARDIKQTIQQIGQTMTPIEAVPASAKQPLHPVLRGRRILVVDADEQVRNDAHALLERYGCVVETAHEGMEAVAMVRGSGGMGSYDAVISDIRLPDFSGYQLMCRLIDLMAPVPMILMTGFGYDPGHSIVKARQAGLHPKAILFKPFRLDQLIEVVETVITHNQALINRCSTSSA